MKFDRNGTCVWAAYVDTAEPNVYAHGIDGSMGSTSKIAIDSNENVYLVSSFYSNPNNRVAEYGSISVTVSGVYSNIVSKINNNGTWEWAVNAHEVSPGYANAPNSITIDPFDNVWVAYKTGNENAMIISKYNNSGFWQGSSATFGGSGSSVVQSHDLHTDSFGDLYLVGSFANSFGYTLQNGTGGTLSCSSCWSGFVAKFDSNAELLWITQASSSSSIPSLSKSSSSP